jgi:hypothetical protein
MTPRSIRYLVLSSKVPWWRRLLNRWQRKPYEPVRPNG